MRPEADMSRVCAFRQWQRFLIWSRVGRVANKVLPLSSASNGVRDLGTTGELHEISIRKRLIGLNFLHPSVGGRIFTCVKN
jgi:hypothetical protein